MQRERERRRLLGVRPSLLLHLLSLVSFYASSDLAAFSLCESCCLTLSEGSWDGMSKALGARLFWESAQRALKVLLIAKYYEYSHNALLWVWTVGTDKVAHHFLRIQVPFSPHCSHCLPGPQTRKVPREGYWEMSKHATGINDYYMLPHTQPEPDFSRIMGCCLTLTCCSCLSEAVCCLFQKMEGVSWGKEGRVVGQWKQARLCSG